MLEKALELLRTLGFQVETMYDPMDTAKVVGIQIGDIQANDSRLDKSKHTMFIPLMDDDSDYRYPKFEYKNEIYVISDIIAMAINSRVEEHGASALPFFKRDILNALSLGIEDRKEIEAFPTRYNTLLRIANKIHLIKDYYYDGAGNRIEDASIGDALAMKRTFNKKEIKSKLGSLTNLTLCKIDSISKSNIVIVPKGQTFVAPFYGLNEENYYSLFDNSPSLPTRLTQAITSDGLLVDEDSIVVNPLLKTKTLNIMRNELEDASGGINCVVAYIPETQENGMFLCGEIYASQDFSNINVKIERTISVPFKIIDIKHIDMEACCGRGSTFAYVMQGEKRIDFKFNIPFKEGTLVGKYSQGDSTIFRFKIDTMVGSTRIISDLGVKGCTIPLVKIGQIVLEDGTVIKPDLVIGPNAMKGDSNQIKAGNYALHLHINQQVENMQPETDTDVAEIVAKVESVPLIKGYWESPLGKIPCYVGVEHVVITKVANDFKFNSVKATPEMLRFLAISGNFKLVEALLEKYMSPTLGQHIHEMLDIILQQPHPKNHYVYNANVAKRLKEWHLNEDTFIYEKMNESVVYHPDFEGCSFEVDGVVMRIPSFSLMDKFIHHINSMNHYPAFGRHAVRLLKSMQWINNMATVHERYSTFIHELKSKLLSKDGLVALASSIRIEGGNFQQLPSNLVPRNVVVLLHWWFEHKKSPFNKVDQYDLYDIGCRNPVLWRKMQNSRRVWTFTEFEDYLQTQGIDIRDIFDSNMFQGTVLRNPLDCIDDQSDADGDLYPMTVPLDNKIQQLCRPVNHIEYGLFDNIVLNKVDGIYMPPEESAFSTKWFAKYYKKESKKIALKPFVINKISRKQFADYFVSGAIAKQDVSIGTISVWRFNTAIEIAIQRGMKPSVAFELMDIYAALFQDYVIRGIKHSFETSDHFSVYLIDNICSKADNMEIVRGTLKEMGVDPENIEQFFKIVYIATLPEVVFLAQMPNGKRSNHDVLMDGIVKIRSGEKVMDELLVGQEILTNVLQYGTYKSHS